MADPFRNNNEVNTYLTRLLDTAGDGTGTTNANGDYSSSEEIFYYQPGIDETLKAFRMMVTVIDTDPMNAEEYGNLGIALTNGIQVRIQNDTGTVNDLTSGFPVTTNARWAVHCYDADIKDWGTGNPRNQVLVVRWSFNRAGTPLRLEGHRNERLEVVLNDNLTGLIGHYFVLQGQLENTPT